MLSVVFFLMKITANCKTLDKKFLVLVKIVTDKCAFDLDWKTDYRINSRWSEDKAEVSSHGQSAKKYSVSLLWSNCWINIDPQLCDLTALHVSIILSWSILKTVLWIYYYLTLAFKTAQEDFQNHKTSIEILMLCGL